MNKYLIFLSLPLVNCAEEIKQNTFDPNPVDRFGTKASYNAYFTGEALWLKPLNAEIVSLSYSSTEKLAHQDYFSNEFQLGLRLTFGVNTNYDGWDTYIAYTALRYSHTNPGFFDSNNVNTPFNLKYNYDINLADYDLGRMFKVSRHLTVRPHLGVRSFWLTQKARLSMPDSGSYDMNKLSSTLIGLEGGIDSFWKFNKGFSLFGNLGLASCVNLQKRTYKSDAVIFTTSELSTIVPALDFALGLRWDITFASGLYHFAFSAGYEQHGYYNINKNALLAPNLASVINSSLLQNPDFSLQGVSLGARFDF